MGDETEIKNEAGSLRDRRESHRPLLLGKIRLVTYRRKFHG
jgi:hypothetical protein